MTCTWCQARQLNIAKQVGVQIFWRVAAGRIYCMVAGRNTSEQAPSVGASAMHAQAHAKIASVSCRSVQCMKRSCKPSPSPARRRSTTTTSPSTMPSISARRSSQRRTAAEYLGLSHATYLYFTKTGICRQRSSKRSFAGGCCSTTRRQHISRASCH